MVCQELCEDVVWPEGKGLSMEYGGNEGFGVGPVIRAFVHFQHTWLYRFSKTS